MTVLEHRPERTHHRVVIVGTGFAGLGMAVRLKRAGIDDFVILERADGPGGTWRDNTYPGCQCDVPSHLYSFSFAPNPSWSRTFSCQPEIQAYLRDIIRRFDLEPHVRWRHQLQDATWDEAEQHWRISTLAGVRTADVLVLGVGPLAEPATPHIPGLDQFRGKVFHSARWDHDHDLRGERVAVVGTGASAIQIVPSIQPIASRIDLYQRTPAWVMPHPDRRITRVEKALYRMLPVTQRMMRALIYIGRESVVLGMAHAPLVIRAVERLARLHIRRHIADPALREQLTPRYELGCKRILISDTFYPAVAQPNVEVVTDGIAHVTPTSVVTGDGTEREVDTIVLATGFHVSDSPSYRLVHGRGGRTLLDAFEEHGAYLGTTCNGFPNLFVLAGPNTGIGHTSLVYMLESQVAYILDGLRQMEQQRAGTVEVRREVQTAFFEEMQRATKGTVWSSGCSSWYLDRHGRNATLWPGFTFSYRRRTRRFDTAAYDLQPLEMAVTGTRRRL